jgi:transcriptional accessory protein Tex/SPT6
MENDEVMVERGDQAQPEEQQSQPTPEAESAQEAADSGEVIEVAEAGDESAQEEEARPSKVEDLKVGMRIEGIVRNMVDFGAFVDIGVGRDGLAHISTLKRAGIDQSLKVGDPVEVQVRRVDLDNQRISLIIPGTGRGSKTGLADLEVGSTVTGRVVRLVDFGAFVDIGAQTDGLLHISQLADGYVRHPSEAVQVGDEVDVRILEVDLDRRRISLSMKSEQVVEPERPRRPSGRTAPKKTPVIMSTADEDARNQGPTAFEVAWQEALANQRTRHRDRS